MRKLLCLLACVAACAPAQTRIAPGQLLVATDRIRDPDFSKSVILIVNTDRRGVQGIWINRPTSVPASGVFPGTKSDTEVYQGGPLRVGINGVVRATQQPEAGVRLLDDVWLVADQRALQKLASTSGSSLRIYIGTCGWSVAQLDDEIDRRGSWTIVPATPAAVFDDDPRTLWNRLAGTNVALNRSNAAKEASRSATLASGSHLASRWCSISSIRLTDPWRMSLIHCAVP